MVGRLRAYMAVVSAIGFVVLALLAVSVDLDRVRDSLPAGAMLALVAAEVLPDAMRRGSASAALGTLLGAVGMLALSAALGV